MADPRKHHFIPAFYLSQWAGPDGLLIEWSRPHKEVKPIRRHPNATGFEYDLYAFLDLLPDTRQWFEKKFLQSTDDIASQVLAKILAGQMKALDNLQKSGWARFLMTLRFVILTWWARYETELQPSGKATTASPERHTNAKGHLMILRLSMNISSS